MKLNSLNSIQLFILVIVSIFAASCKNEKSLLLNVEKVALVDKVYPLLDTENSRWFYFSSACRPFGMVNLSPDTEKNGAWGSGYKYKTDTIKGFSHIHAWQMSGLSIMPVTLAKTIKKNIYTDFYSKFSHDTEKVSPGHHYLHLDKYNIDVELTSSKRVGFHKYTFLNSESENAILFNLNTLLGPSANIKGALIKDGDKELSGSLIMEPTHRRPKPVTLYFKIKLNTEITTLDQDVATKNYLVNLNTSADEVLMKVGISYTSIDNANENIEKEIPNWDFENIVTSSKIEWNNLLSRIEVEGGTTKEQRRFYTDLWHALQGRRIISDYNGAYPDNTRETFRVGQIPLKENGEPQFNHYNSDSFWGAQWTINILWGLVYPEYMEDFTNSLMQYYKDGGLVPRGPSGGNYTYVMTGASSTPFIVSAIQKSIIKDNLEDIYTALKKNHMPNGIMGKAGYEHYTNVGGGLNYYLENGYVPSPFPLDNSDGKYGTHLDGTSQTLEYAYQDWTLAQLAKKLGKTDDYIYFTERSKNYKNVFDTNRGWMGPKTLEGKWKVDFDPYQYENGFVESNAAQSTWFVPHDIIGLASLMGGKDKAAEKLNTQFKEAQKLKFTSGNSHEAELHPEYSRIPVNFGNQPSIQTSFVFNQLDRYDLTQYWTRRVISDAFSGLAPNTGYCGDEDQGFMGSLNVLLKIGLFQMNGGTEENPIYEIGSPIFNKITIKLNEAYYPGKTFSINAPKNSKDNVYVTKILYNGSPVKTYSISHKNIVQGGDLYLEMSAEPM